eukprot:1407650-Amphidinium_carterae.1
MTVLNGVLTYEVPLTARTFFSEEPPSYIGRIATRFAYNGDAIEGWGGGKVFFQATRRFVLVRLAL